MKRKPKVAEEFAVRQDCCNSLELTVRCVQWTIVQTDGDGDDELTPEDVQLWDRIVAVLNENADRILGADSA